jgi:nicotinamidase-related amidase
MTIRALGIRAREAVGDEADQATTIFRSDWDDAKTAVVVCDMWDTHHCVSAARRVADMAPRMDALIRNLRREGALIIHAPHDCMDFYRDTRARMQAVHAPLAETPIPIGWNSWEADETTLLPQTLIHPGPCSCDSPAPCNDGQGPYPWTRQTPAIQISADDAVSDDGQEVVNLLEQRRIMDVVLMGVHTNVCVLSRPYGIRQLVRLGKSPVLCRDLTDSFHRDPRGHDWGNEQIIAHVERRWCPTVTSDELVGGTTP